MKKIVNSTRIFSKYHTMLWYFNRFIKSKKKYLSDKFQGDSKKTCTVMNKMIGKSCINQFYTTKNSCRQHRNNGKIKYCKKNFFSQLIFLKH